MNDKETQKVEAFSDGVFAIAMTLLILEIRVPQISGEPTGPELVRALCLAWPSFVAYLMSFWVILVMWINHHELFQMVRRSDYRLFFANGFLLMLVTFVPFPTAVLARFLGTAARNAAAAFYCATFVLLSIAYILLVESIASHRRLVRDEVPAEVLSRIRKTYRLGLIVYLSAAILAGWNAWLGLGLCSSLWLVWTRLLYRSAPSPKPERTHVDSIPQQT